MTSMIDRKSVEADARRIALENWRENLDRLFDVREGRGLGPRRSRQDRQQEEARRRSKEEDASRLRARQEKIDARRREEQEARRAEARRETAAAPIRAAAQMAAITIEDGCLICGVELTVANASRSRRGPYHGPNIRDVGRWSELGGVYGDCCRTCADAMQGARNPHNAMASSVRRTRKDLAEKLPRGKVPNVRRHAFFVLVLDARREGRREPKPASRPFAHIKEWI